MPDTIPQGIGCLLFAERDETGEYSTGGIYAYCVSVVSHPTALSALDGVSVHPVRAMAVRGLVSRVLYSPKRSLRRLNAAERSAESPSSRGLWSLVPSTA